MAKAPKKLKITKEIREAINVMGPEPSNDKPVDISLLRRYLNWYNYVYDHNYAKQFLIDWAAANDHPKLEVIRGYNVKRLPQTYGYMARMMSNGLDIIDSEVQKFNDWVNSLEAEDTREETEEVDEETKHDPATPIEVIGWVINNIKSAGKDFFPSDWINSNRFNKQTLEEIEQFARDHMTKIRSKIEKATNEGKYKDLDKFRSQYILLRNLVVAISDKPKRVVVRKPRTVKPKTPAQILKFFKCSEGNEELGITSIEPEKILTSEALFTLNTSNNTLTIFYANDGQMLSVNRTSIINYDPNKTISKKVGRQLAKVIETITTGSKVQRHKVLNNIKSNPLKISDRINSNVVLLFAEKKR